MHLFFIYIAYKKIKLKYVYVAFLTLISLSLAIHGEATTTVSINGSQFSQDNNPVTTYQNGNGKYATSNYNSYKEVNIYAFAGILDAGGSAQVGIMYSYTFPQTSFYQIQFTIELNGKVTNGDNNMRFDVTAKESTPNCSGCQPTTYTYISDTGTQNYADQTYTFVVFSQDYSTGQSYTFELLFYAHCWQNLWSYNQAYVHFGGGSQLIYLHSMNIVEFPFQ